MGECVARVNFVPVEMRGPWWRRHRHWLTTPARFTGTWGIVVNTRTGVIHVWGFRGNRQGWRWFGDWTRWAWLHPAWKRDPWVLFYDPMSRDLTAR
jgi:hypothetical protein